MHLPYSVHFFLIFSPNFPAMKCAAKSLLPPFPWRLHKLIEFASVSDFLQCPPFRAELHRFSSHALFMRLCDVTSAKLRGAILYPRWQLRLWWKRHRFARLTVTSQLLSGNLQHESWHLVILCAWFCLQKIQNTIEGITAKRGDQKVSCEQINVQINNFCSSNTCAGYPIPFCFKSPNWNIL